jgi:hypothetical protein
MTTDVNAQVTPAPDARPVQRGISMFAWILVVLIVLIAILGIAHLGITLFKSLEPPVSGASGSLLYATTFDEFPAEWSQFDGQMSSKIADGSLRININASNDGAFSVLSYNFADFDARINTTRLSANDDYNEIGLLFRYQNPANFYMFKIRGDSYYRVERRKDNVTDVLSEWHPSSALANGLNTANQLRVVGKGSGFEFYVNNQQLVLCPSGPEKQKSTWNGEQCLSNNGQTAMALQDTSFKQGKIGLAVSVDIAGIEVAFDDVTVYAP